MKLEQKHIDFMRECSDGAIIRGCQDAETAREIQKFDPSFLHFIEDMDVLGKENPVVRKLTGVFGCVLLHDGVAYLERWESENK